MALELLADIWLYPTNEGGKTKPAYSNYGCPLFVSKDISKGGWDARLKLEDGPFEPGAKRRLTLAFLSEEGAKTIKEAGRFYLWEGRIVGEGSVVAGEQE